MPSPAVTAVAAIPHKIQTHARVRSVAEAAAVLGIDVADLVKTIVVRRAADSYVFVLVPGGRVISWPKLRARLGANRLSLPDAATAKEVTGYERGTITPFGSLTPWPVLADERIQGHTISLGAGEHGVAIVVAADDAVSLLGGEYADVTEPEPTA